MLIFILCKSYYRLCFLVVFDEIRLINKIAESPCVEYGTDNAIFEGLFHLRSQNTRGFKAVFRYFSFVGDDVLKSSYILHFFLFYIIFFSILNPQCNLICTPPDPHTLIEWYARRWNSAPKSESYQTMLKRTECISDK